MNYLESYNFYFELPLYTSIEITPEKLSEFEMLMKFEGKINAYNPTLKEQTTYEVTIRRHYQNHCLNPVYYILTHCSILKCLRSGEIFECYFYTYLKRGNNNYFLQKIGQKPSIADLHISQIKDFSKVLTKEKMREFTKAIGLVANGVGIGSFVYLRRIFEHLIEEAHLKSKIETGWDETTFQKSRMNEKIEILKTRLPDFLVEHKELYGILSKGIHELEEEECLRHFVPVRIGIEMILEEKLIEFEKAEKRAKASNAIKGIGQLGKQ